MFRTILRALTLVIVYVLGAFTLIPIARAVETASSAVCDRVAPCLTARNSSTGLGLKAISSDGSAILAQTRANERTPNAAVRGEDLASNGTANAGIFGSSVHGIGVRAVSDHGVAIRTFAPNNYALEALSHATAIVAGSNAGQAVLGEDSSGTSGGTAIWGASQRGMGVMASSDGSTSGSAFRAFSPNGADILDGSGPGGEAIHVDGNGNMRIAGQLTTAGSCRQGCSNSRRSIAYTTSSAEPTIEDAGESQLRYGAAYVPLDAAFANTIDPRRGYLVFVSPEEDTRGVYVSARTNNGFYVREDAGGRSIARFAYRIIAHPYAAHGNRLPIIDVPSVPRKALRWLPVSE